MTASASDMPGPVVTSETEYDFLGRAVSVTMPLGITSNFYDSTSDRVTRVSRTGSPDTLYVYDELGNVTATALDVDGDGQVTATDRVSSSVMRYEEDASNAWWRVTSQAQSCGGVTNSASEVREQLTGLSNAHQSCIVMVDADGVATTETVSYDPVTHVTAATTANPLQVTPAVRLSKYGHVLEAQTLGRRASNAYDGFSRAVTQTLCSAGGFTNSVLDIVYDAYGQVVTNRSVCGADEAVAVIGYDAQGRAVSQTDALGNVVETAYDSLGNVTVTWGATYLAAYGYDTWGRSISGVPLRANTSPQSLRAAARLTEARTRA